MTGFASGLWTHIARLPNSYETVKECMTFKFSLNGNIFRIDSVDIPEDAHNYVDGEGIVQPDGKILFNVSTGFPRQTVQITLTVLFAENEKYAVVYDCFHDEDKKIIDSVWILGRKSVLDKGDMNKLYEFIKTSKIIDINKLIWINNSDEICKRQ